MKLRDDPNIINEVASLRRDLDELAISGTGGGGGGGKVSNITSNDGTVKVTTGTDAVDLSVATSLAKKVDKVEGKGLSTNDYTTTEKTKLAGIEDGAQKNLPNTVTDAHYVHTDNNLTSDLLNAINKAQEVIPAEASATNQLADKKYVDEHGGGGGAVPTKLSQLEDDINNVTYEDAGETTNTPWVSDSMMINQKVDVDSTIIDNYSGTILDLVKGIYPKGYHRWYTTTDGATQYITDRPTGTENKGLIIEAFKTRDYTTSSYSYRVVARTSKNRETYETYLNSEETATTAFTWARVLNSMQTDMITPAMAQKISTDIRSKLVNGAAAPSDINLYRAVATQTAGIVVLDLIVRSQTGFATGDSGSLLVLPEAYRPRQIITSLCNMTTNYNYPDWNSSSTTTQTPAFLRISTDGTICVRTNNSGQKVIQIHVVY